MIRSLAAKAFLRPEGTIDVASELGQTRIGMQGGDQVGRTSPVGRPRRAPPNNEPRAHAPPVKSPKTPAISAIRTRMTSTRCLSKDAITKKEMTTAQTVPRHPTAK